jgi:hypothetical protein
VKKNQNTIGQYFCPRLYALAKNYTETIDIQKLVAREKVYKTD